MTDSKIRVLVVDDSLTTRDNVRKLLQFEDGIEIIGEAHDGDEAVRLAKELEPDCILMDINMPNTDGIQATRAINSVLAHAVIIIMSVQGDQEYLRKAMMAGARDFLTKPFNGDELINTIRHLHREEQERLKHLGVEPAKQRNGKLLVVFGAKGGVGKSTVATNLAVALAQKGKSTVLMDLDLQFGDVSILLNLSARRTIADWVQDSEADIASYLLEYSPDLQVLAAPEQPEEGELVTSEHVGEAISRLKKIADYVIIDTPPVLDEGVLEGLERADEIIIVANADLPNLKNLAKLLDLCRKLALEKKIRILLNRITPGTGLTVEEFANHLALPLWHQVPGEDKLVLEAANQGIPFVQSQPKAKITQSIKEMADLLVNPVDSEKKKPRKLIFWR